MARHIAYEVAGELACDDGGRDVRCHVASSFGDRLVGLIGQREVPPGRLMAFPHCPSVHTFWMRVPIDVMWLARPDADGWMAVLGIADSLPPGRVAAGPRGTWCAAEARAGTMVALGPARLRVDGIGGDAL